MTATIVVGNRYGRLVIMGIAAKDTHGRRMVHCRCDCGQERTIAFYRFAAQGTQSCGCLRLENCSRRMTRLNLKHGGRHRVEYNVWRSMKKRCCDPANASYPAYGGRGIRVCASWLESFEAFLRDVGPRPSRKHSIDRIDNNGNYEPGNARWATQEQQDRNKRTNRFLTMGGRTLCAADWSRLLLIPRSTISLRMRKGWPAERVLDKAVQCA